MTEVEPKNLLTILDYLNDDCLWLVLKYVPVKDIILSERVSRQWQRMVLTYLQSVPIGIQDIYERYNYAPFKVCWLKLNKADLSSFCSWTIKIGPSVVVAHCDSEKIFEILGENCPNLKVVTFSWLSEEQLMNNENENFKSLLRVSFNTLKISEYYLSEFIASDELEELAFWFCEDVSGECLLNIKSTKLKYFGFDDSNQSLDIRHLLAVADRLAGLTRLELNDISEEACNNLYLLLDKLPKLEHLLIDTAYTGDTVRCDNFFKSVCGLNRLKGLVTTISPTHEGLLEAVVKCCKELNTLDLRYSDYVTGRGLAAVCARAGARLVSLGVRDNDHITDDDVVACVRACPNLESLMLRSCCLLSAAVVARAAAARRGLPGGRGTQGGRGVLLLDLTYCEGMEGHDYLWDDCNRYEADGLVLYSDCE